MTEDDDKLIEALSTRYEGYGQIAALMREAAKRLREVLAERDEAHAAILILTDPGNGVAIPNGKPLWEVIRTAARTRADKGGEG